MNHGDSHGTETPGALISHSFGVRNASGLRFDFLTANGALCEMNKGDIGINLFPGSPLSPGVANVYLRVLRDGKLSSTPMVGRDNDAHISTDGGTIRWRASFMGVAYVCALLPDPEHDLWFWKIELSHPSGTGVACDLVYVLDKGLAERTAVRNNELFASHYTDCAALLSDGCGYVLLSRRNIESSGGFPWLMEGSLDGVEGFATDFADLYGASARETGSPRLLGLEWFPSSVLQRQHACTVLKSPFITLNSGGRTERSFFCLFQDTHPEASSASDLSRLPFIRERFSFLESRQSEGSFLTVEKPRALIVEAPGAGAEINGLRTSEPEACVSLRADRLPLLRPIDLEPGELETLFGNGTRHAERSGGKLLSFFTETTHVVLKAKETEFDVPHGQILTTGTELYPGTEILAVTTSMAGRFASHATVGNTVFNRFLSSVRDQYGAVKMNGLRIAVETEGAEFLLGVPSAYEMGIDFCRWVYRHPGGIIVVAVKADEREPVLHLFAKASGTQVRRFSAIAEVAFGPDDREDGGTATPDGKNGRIFLEPDPGSATGTAYPFARFFIAAADPESVSRVSVLRFPGEEGDRPTGGTRYAELECLGSEPLHVLLGGYIEGNTGEKIERCISAARGSSMRLDAPMTSGADRKRVAGNLRIILADDGRSEFVSALSDTLYWFASNARIHFRSPHGLEQRNGGAWAVRDVLQGPFEFLLALGKYDEMKKILHAVFSRQHIETGDWPQWFMFDEYRSVQPGTSHGDIAVWPIKALIEYVNAAGDDSILSDPVPYTVKSSKEKAFTKESYTVSHHLRSAFEKISGNTVPGTALPLLGEGDWDDSLQPADPSWKTETASGWTAIIAHQYLDALVPILQRVEEHEFAARVSEYVSRLASDIKEYVLGGGIASGFVRFRKDGSYGRLFHPEDTETGISCRLLPMVRGILSGFFTPDEAEAQYRLIMDRLVFPDGVRLMDRPTRYRGGVSTHFKRSEQSAFFGRESGLLYVHEQIRFIEAMLMFGKPEAAVRALERTVPIGIERRVRNALRRQSNCYFSSADAAFSSRYQAEREFDKLRSGEIGSASGWRIYSSGPGILFRIITECLFGIRRRGNTIEFDPVLPASWNGIELFRDYDEMRTVLFRFGTGETHTSGVAGITVNDSIPAVTELSNPYRKAGVRMDVREFESLLTDGTNTVTIRLG